MFVAATLTLLTTVIAQGPGGQDQGQEAKPILTEREQSTLNDRLRQYLADEAEYDLATGVRDREKAAKARMKSKEKFESEWEKLEKKGNLLGSMPDLRAIFYNCFEREKPRHSLGQLRKEKLDLEDTEKDLEYSFFTPKKYRPTEPWTTLVVLPDAAGQPGQWVDPYDYFKATWEDAELLDQAIVHMPVVPAGVELDPVPDYSREGSEAMEDNRIRAVLQTFGAIMNGYNVDRDRVFLDCGRGSCGFGVRLVTLFPDRFAGLILRDPVPVDELRLGNLIGIPILMLKTAANGAVVDALQKRLEEKNPGTVTVIDAKGAAPHKESAADIAQWLADKKRKMSPSHVVLEPNHDRFNRAYWVDIYVADSLLNAPVDKKPRLEVKADRASNRITVDAVGVDRFELVLNDAPGDLDKPFPLVNNGKGVAPSARRRKAWSAATTGATCSRCAT